jgi:hypothetical protein
VSPLLRRWTVPLLVVAAIVGGVLILTAEDDEEPLPLEETVTAEGLATRIPQGWVAGGDFAFEYVPPTDAGGGFDRWIVARACPVEGCRTRSLDEWRGLARDLPTFVEARAEQDEGLFDIEEGFEGDAFVLRARTLSAAEVVLVAAFLDDTDFYVACSVQASLGADDRLADAVVDVCRSTREASEAAAR